MVGDSPPFPVLISKYLETANVRAFGAFADLGIGVGTISGFRTKGWVTICRGARAVPIRVTLTFASISLNEK